MADKKLEYWCDWVICGPDGQIADLRSMGPPIDKDLLSDVDYLCRVIDDYPDRALMNRNVWYRILMLRKAAFKDENIANSLERVCKSICGDGRARKKREDINELKNMIESDIKFYREIRDRIKNKDQNVDEAIDSWLTGAARSQAAVDRRLQERSNYRNTYYAYNRIYKNLSSKKMTDAEIFTFFKAAAVNLENPNAIIDARGKKRNLEFTKTSTWYVEGDNMAVSSFCIDAEEV